MEFPIMTGRGACSSGFTLIELLIVMAIIGTLLSIAVPKYFHAMEHARETVLKQDLAILREALDKHYADLGRYPESLAELVERRYVRAVPRDPFTGSADSWILVAPEDSDQPGVRDVRSGAAEAASDGTSVTTW
jgi:general secretion pathway protein G